MMKDIELFSQMLNIDSTSGQEAEFAQWCMSHLEAPDKQLLQLDDDQIAVLLSWSAKPKLVFCSHLDTVPPYIPPTFYYEDGTIELTSNISAAAQKLPKRILGRGSNDAKGQIFSMYMACKCLEERGLSDFALLLLSGEEVGSRGAKAFSRIGFKAPYLLVGEPTDNCMVTAAKGTKRFELTFKGKACHSGYPEYGSSAVDAFVDFCNRLREMEFPLDPEMGVTTWNIGRLRSDNAQNILSPCLTCSLYFRTTAASDVEIQEWMCSQRSDSLDIRECGGDAPMRFHTVEGLPSKTVAFGSDAPHLDGFAYKMICGPGSIMTSHREQENIEVEDIDIAIKNYIKIYESCD